MENFVKTLKKQFDVMCMTGKLFRVALSGQQVWDLYLKSFKNDPKFRDPASSDHNCNNCKNFIRRYGNIVAINSDFDVVTMFDVISDNEEFVPVVKALTQTIKMAKVTEIFFETFAELNSLPYESCNKGAINFRLGMASNVKRYTKEEVIKFGVVNTEDIYTFHHLHLDLPSRYVDQSGKSVEAIMAEYRDAKNVFQRAMEEISLDTLSLVRDLINQGSLLDGAAHLYKVDTMIPLKEVYDLLAASQRDNWCWINSYGFNLAKFKNELIGVLCSELSEGKELNDACQAWNKRVDPANYMKVTAPITEKQKKEQIAFLEENGYTDSFDRRFATMDDIKVSEILHSNVGKGEIKSVSIFDKVKTASTRHKRNEFDGVEEIGIEKFMTSILPSCTSIEAFLTNNQEGNMVSLTTANKKDSKPIFKWNNNYSWTFNGNLAGKSQIKEAVKLQGGRVDGVLRFSMIWNELGKDGSDLDAWCQEPDKTQIGYSMGYRKDRGDKFTKSSGQLDLDNTSPGGKLAVENIYYADLSRMQDGVYKFWVNQFSERNSVGFKAEIEFNGESYNYEQKGRVVGTITVAEVTLKNGVFTIKHFMTPTEGLGTSKEIYGLETNNFHKVNLVCLSPNHWEGNEAGNKHYMFMLDGCKSPEPIRTFHNENLSAELLPQKRLLESFGSLHLAETTDKQLSGLGFNATVRDEVILKLGGTHKRVVKVKF